MAIVSLSARTIRSKSFADGLLPQYQPARLAPNISSIQYLAIAGGGAGGVTNGGGGGAGGFSENYLTGLNFNVLGNSVYFDGTGDMLSYLLTDPSPITVSGDFTVEAWVYPTASESSYFFYFGAQKESYEGDRGIALTKTGGFLYVAGTGGGATGYTVTYPTAIQQNVWQHIALVRSGGSLTAYLNGQPGASTSASGLIRPYLNRGDLSGSLGFYTGTAVANWTAFTPTYYAGYISNLRFVNGTAVYTSAFTPPTSPLTAVANTNLLLCQSSTIVDRSSNALIITRNGDASVVANGPFFPNVTSTANLTLSIIIGAGGAGSGVASTQGANGGNTLIHSPVGLAANVLMIGGGGGGYYNASVQTNGSNGGSGGGAGAGGSGQSRSGGSGYGYPSPAQQGNPGGANFAQDGTGASGGGGGANGIGTTGTSNQSGGGAAGKVSSIIGYPQVYAGGGGGGGATAAGGAGVGAGYEGAWTASGAGTTGPSTTPAGSGNSNSGSGGGGGNASPFGNSGSGGSGVVILRYPDTFANAIVTGNPNVYYRAQNIIYRFHQSGSITFVNVPSYLL
jgi:hypothetical protein